MPNEEAVVLASGRMGAARYSDECLLQEVELCCALCSAAVHSRLSMRRRIEAIEPIGTLVDAGCAPLLLEHKIVAKLILLLDQEDLREAALRALRRLWDELDDFAIAELSSPESSDVLCTASASDEAEIAAMAGGLLCCLCDHKATPREFRERAVAFILEHGRRDVEEAKEEAAWAIASMAASLENADLLMPHFDAILGLLLELAAHETPSVRVQAVWALANLVLALGDGAKELMAAQAFPTLLALLQHGGGHAARQTEASSSFADVVNDDEEAAEAHAIVRQVIRCLGSLLVLPSARQQLLRATERARWVHGDSPRDSPLATLCHHATEHAEAVARALVHACHAPHSAALALLRTPAAPEQLARLLRGPRGLPRGLEPSRQQERAATCVLYLAGAASMAAQAAAQQAAAGAAAEASYGAAAEATAEATADVTADVTPDEICSASSSSVLARHPAAVGMTREGSKPGGDSGGASKCAAEAVPMDGCAAELTSLHGALDSIAVSAKRTTAMVMLGGVAPMTAPMTGEVKLGCKLPRPTAARPADAAAPLAVCIQPLLVLLHVDNVTCMHASLALGLLASCGEASCGRLLREGALEQLVATIRSPGSPALRASTAATTAVERLSDCLTPGSRRAVMSSILPTTRLRREGGKVASRESDGRGRCSPRE